MEPDSMVDRCCASATESQVAYGPASITTKARTAQCQREIVMEGFLLRTMIAREIAILQRHPNGRTYTI
jgi:hypothetical protein